MKKGRVGGKLTKTPVNTFYLIIYNILFFIFVDTFEYPIYRVEDEPIQCVSVDTVLNYPKIP